MSRLLMLARVLVGAGAAAAAFALMACGENSAANPNGFYGIHPQSELTETDLELMREGGIELARGLVPWGAIEAEQGTYDWSAVDETVRGLAAHGIEPMLFLYGSTAWATAEDGHACEPGGIPDCGAFVPASDATQQAFAEFARAAVERYRPEGEFWSEGDASCGLPFEIPVVCEAEEPPCECDEPVPVTTWQVWNEPNSPKYAAPDASARAFAALLEPTAEAIRAADPEAEVVLGGIWGPREPPGDARRAPLVPVGEFLDRLYRFPGIDASFDAVAVHPYSPDVRGVLDQVADAQRAIEVAGDDAGIYITEIGWASSGPEDSRLVKGEAGQAQMLLRTFSAFERHRRAFRLRGVFWYTWRDGGGAGICEWCAGAGLHTAFGAPKPAWYQLIQFTGGSD
jgi:hypothetical protein